MLVSGKKVNKMARADSLSPILTLMTEAGKMVKCTELEHTNQMLTELRENGNMET